MENEIIDSTDYILVIDSNGDLKTVYYATEGDQELPATIVRAMKEIWNIHESEIIPKTRQ